MGNLFKTNLGRLRIVGFFEGVSLLILFFWAMPMKYIYGQPEFVRMVGSIHGALFVAFVYQIYITAEEKGWSYKDLPLKLFISSFLPFGTLYYDHKVLKNIQD